MADRLHQQGSLYLPMLGLYAQVDAHNLYDGVLGLLDDDAIYNPGGFAI